MPAVLLELERAGRVILNGVRLFTDPKIYKPFELEKRYSAMKCLGGDIAIQDFGMYTSDGKLLLGSGGDQGVIDQEAIKTFLEMYQTRGGVYRLEDWLGNHFDVFIAKFTFHPLLFTPDPLFEYDMECHITAITQLFGSARVEPY